MTLVGLTTKALCVFVRRERGGGFLIKLTIEKRLKPPFENFGQNRMQKARTGGSNVERSVGRSVGRSV